MNTKNSTAFKAARKTTLAAAIALAAAAPAFAASAPSEWAGYPTSDAVQFQPQTAPLSTPVVIVVSEVQARDVQTTDMSTTDMFTTDMSTADTSRTAMPTATADSGMAQASNDSSASTAADPAAAAADVQVADTTAWVLIPVDTTPATLPQWQPPAITRESVRAETLAARQAGTLTPANEVGDTERVLAARQAFNQEQSDAIVAEYQAEYDRQVAMQEAEIRRAAIEADWLQYGMAQQSPTSSDDPTAEVQIDVISMQPLGVGE